MSLEPLLGASLSKARVVCRLTDRHLCKGRELGWEQHDVGPVSQRAELEVGDHVDGQRVALVRRRGEERQEETLLEHVRREPRHAVLPRRVGLRARKTAPADA
eukprot:6200592-Pleurochrysis_carterae.AAC.2